MSSTILAPFQLIELNIVSAQDLAPVSRTMRTYAVAWVHPDRRLSTRVDTYGHNSPKWNDKFVFRVEDEFLHEDTSAVMIEIYALHWCRDIHVGTVRVLAGNLIPPNKRTDKNNCPQLGMRFVALQVRRSSGRPQGILNIGIALLHSSMRSMPLYSQLSTSAVGYKELMMGESTTEYSNKNPKSNSSQQISIAKPELRRTKSDSCSMIEYDMRSIEFREKGKKTKAKSEIKSNTTSTKHKKGSSKSNSSLATVSSCSITNKKEKHNKGKKGSRSLVSGSGGTGGSNVILDAKTESSLVTNSEANSEIFPLKKVFDEIPTHITKASPIVINNMMARTTPGKSPFIKFKPTPGQYEYNTPAAKSNMVGRTFMTESELGPSASEVAVAIANNKAAADDNESSIVAYSIDESVEGLQSKLERWRTELPAVYDRSEDGEQHSVYKSSGARHRRRHTDGGNGLFSCFSNICGCECQELWGVRSWLTSHLKPPEPTYQKPPAATAAFFEIQKQQMILEAAGCEVIAYLTPEVSRFEAAEISL